VSEEQPTLDDCLATCSAIASYLPGRDLISDSHLQQIVNGTVIRSTGTFVAITGLVSEQYDLQAAMLSRSLFEDMVVTHWLALHADAPEFLTERFIAHHEAILVQHYRARERLGWTLDSSPEPARLLEREAELVKRFGKHAERDWWGVSRDGQRMTMPAVVAALSASERFVPRLRGEQPVLEQMYAAAQKFQTQCLHHTAVGLPIVPQRDDRMPLGVEEPSPFAVLHVAYWTYAQIVYLVLECQPASAGEFEWLFLDGLYGVIGPALLGSEPAG
jgi:hypothetical protein